MATKVSIAVKIIVAYVLANIAFIAVIKNYKAIKAKTILYTLWVKDDISIPNIFSIQKVEDLVIVPSGRLGNNIRQLSNALYYCESLGCKTITVPNNFWFVPDTFEYKEYKILVRKAETNKTIDLCKAGDKKTFCTKIGLYYGVRPEPRVSVFKDYFLEQIPPVVVDKNALYIHIRGGDIFKAEKPNWRYSQPPLCYYTEAIRAKNFSHVYVISEDRLNPVVEALEREVNATVINGSLESDIAYILGARHYVMSKGTFSRELLLFSEQKDSLYSWGYPVYGQASVYNVPTLEYKFKFTKWQNSKAQRQAMMEMKCGKWVEATEQDGEMYYNKMQ